jgi:hypothetical protein
MSLHIKTWILKEAAKAHRALTRTFKGRQYWTVNYADVLLHPMVAAIIAHYRIAGALAIHKSND